MLQGSAVDRNQSIGGDGMQRPGHFSLIRATKIMCTRLRRSRFCWPACGWLTCWTASSNRPQWPRARRCRPRRLRHAPERVNDFDTAGFGI